MSPEFSYVFGNFCSNALVVAGFSIRYKPTFRTTENRIEIRCNLKDLCVQKDRRWKATLLYTM